MLDVLITYHSKTRLMEITAISTTYDDSHDDSPQLAKSSKTSKCTASSSTPIATTGDDKMTTLTFAFDDPDYELYGYTARVEYGANVIGPNSNAYKPFTVLGIFGEPNEASGESLIDGMETYSTELTQSILSSVKCGILPIQLAFSKELTREEKTEFYSLNILNLAIEKSLDAVQDTNVERDPKFGDAIYDVHYDRYTSTFYFEQVDGTRIDITLSDLSEEHYEVDTYDDLVTLEQAESGDTATALDTGVWYKLYGEYNYIDDWYEMPGGALLNGEPTTSPMFYAPIQSGESRQVLMSNGPNESPEWRTMSRTFYINFSNYDTVNVQLYNAYQGRITRWIDTDGSNFHCVFFDRDTMECIDLPYRIVLDSQSEGVRLFSIDVTNKIHNRIKMDVYSMPSLGGVY